MIQGITGKEGSFHATKCLEYGTRIVGGVTPGKGGTKVLGNIEVYENMKVAVKDTKANTSPDFGCIQMAAPFFVINIFSI